VHSFLTFSFADLSCSGSFWKKMEPVFAPICSGDSSYLKQQVVATGKILLALL
jgi:hypothetical protein